MLCSLHKKPTSRLRPFAAKPFVIEWFFIERLRDLVRCCLRKMRHRPGNLRNCHGIRRSRTGQSICLSLYVVTDNPEHFFKEATHLCAIGSRSQVEWNSPEPLVSVSRSKSDELFDHRVTQQAAGRLCIWKCGPNFLLPEFY